MTIASQVEGRGESNGAGGSDRGLEALRDLVGSDLDRVNAEILNRLQSEVPLIPELASHLIASGGKRIRPLLTLAAARLCGYAGDAHILLAACVEFIHTATLLHDDVVDESALRRGSATANTLWGNQASVLVGDFLFSRAFQLMVGAKSLEVLRILSSASAVIAEGEVLQLVTQNDTATKESDYLRVIEGKTAALFAAACRVGAVIADRPMTEAEALDSYGRNLGVAFQLVDDALDYSPRRALLGKNIGDDFKEGKITLPVLLAIERGSDLERVFWKRTLERPDEQGPNDLETAMHYIERHNTIADTIARARDYGKTAADALNMFADRSQAQEEIRRSMLDAIAFTVNRSY